MAGLARRVLLSSSKLIPNKQYAASTVPVRYLNLHEYQSKRLMEDHGIAVQKFEIVDNPADAKQATQKLNASEYVVKAMIMAGGRGKGTFDTGFKGGVHLTKDPDKVAGFVESMIGNRLRTKQTQPEGVKVNKVMIAQALDIKKGRECYFAIVMDREHNGPVLVGSPKGGVDIEEVAAKTPEAIFKIPIDIHDGINDEQAKQMATNLEFEGDKLKQATEEIKKLYNMFIKVDGSQVEINPFAETEDGQVVCFDAKLNFDDSAYFRQEEIFAQNDTSESDPREVEATSHGLNYIGMDGNIGCMVNGAGLAMATMDIVKLHGESPANFLDCGGGVTEEQVYHAFRILTNDSHVKAILVNIFGGIVDCETIARGITNAARSIKLHVPMVVRLEGTNVDGAKKILEESGLPIQSATSFEEVAQKAVQSLRK